MNQGSYRTEVSLREDGKFLVSRQWGNGGNNWIEVSRYTTTNYKNPRKHLTYVWPNQWPWIIAQETANLPAIELQPAPFIAPNVFDVIEGQRFYIDLLERKQAAYLQMTLPSHDWKKEYIEGDWNVEKPTEVASNPPIPYKVYPGSNG